MSEYACFLSYSDQDRLASDRVRGALNSRGLPVFIDRHSISPGEDWRAKIRTGITESEAVVVLVTEASIVSGPVLEEIDIALKHDVPVIPVILQQSSIDKPSPLLDRIADKQWIRMPKGVSQRTSNVDLDAVVRAVRRRWRPTSPVIAVSNLKGGVGKTTLAAHVFSALGNSKQLSILLIDLDPQANLSQFVLPQKTLFRLVEDDKSVLSLFEKSLVHGAASPRSTLFSVNTSPIERIAISDIAEQVGSSELATMAGLEPKPVFLIPGQFELVKYTLPMNAGSLSQAKSNFLRSITAAQKEYDVIVIDLNPSSSFMIECALTAATHVLCPMRPEKYSIQGLEGMKRLIDGAYGLPNPPKVIGIFNGVPTWEGLAETVRQNVDNPAKLGELKADRRFGDCVEPVLEVLNKKSILSELIFTEVPETKMLRAYFEGSSSAFFGLASFPRRGPYGSKLRERLRSIAHQIAEITKAESLDVPTLRPAP